MEREPHCQRSGDTPYCGEPVQLFLVDVRTSGVRSGTLASASPVGRLPIASSELKELQMALMAAYGRTDTRPFQPHVTLARIPQSGWALARKHPIDQPLSLTQCVASVELFQSPPKGQSGYRVLASLPLGAGQASEPLQ